jgi:hypothetical protein
MLIATTLGTWRCKEFCSVIQFLWTQHVSCIDVSRQLMEVYGDGVLRL